MSLNYRGLFEKWEVERVEKLVSKFQRQYPLMRLEGEKDLIQECLIHWIDRKAMYDSNRGASLKTFLTRVVENFLRGVRDSIHCQKRKVFYEAASFNAPHRADESPLEATLEDRNCARIKADIQIVMQQLTSEQLQICQYIHNEGLSLNAISKELNQHHSHVYREVERIRELFEKEGLREYLREKSEEFRESRCKKTVSHEWEGK